MENPSGCDYWRAGLIFPFIRGNFDNRECSNFRAGLIENVLESSAQFTRPASDITIGNWTTSPLFSKINEVNYDDSNYIISSSTGADTSEVKLGSLNTPTDKNNHIVKFRYGASGTGFGNVTVGLYQGAALIRQSYYTGITGSYLNGTFTLSTSEATSISDYSDLRVRFSAS